MPANVKASDLQRYFNELEKLEAHLGSRLNEEIQLEILSSITAAKRKIKAMIGSLPDTEYKHAKMLDVIFELGENEVAPLLAKVAFILKSTYSIMGADLLLSELLEKIS